MATLPARAVGRPSAARFDIDLDAEHALIEAEDVGEAFTVHPVGLEEEHRLVTAGEHGRTDDHAAIAAEPATRDLERDRLFRSAFQYDTTSAVTTLSIQRRPSAHSGRTSTILA